MPGFQAEHAQCNGCGLMLRGPHKDKVFEDHNVYAADSERVYTRDEAEAVGLPHNVSGSMCPDCWQDTYRRYKEEKARAEAVKPSSQAHRDEVKEQRRLSHERYAAQIQARKEYEAAAREERRINREARQTERVRRNYRKSHAPRTPDLP